jgi:hypothetical protein
MPGIVPITTATLGVKSGFAEKVIRGLANGEYERVGGVIRRVDNKRVVTWLRTVRVEFDWSKLINLGPLMQLTAATSLLNLSVTAIGFAMVMQRLNAIQHKLDAIAKVLEEVNRKLDLSFYANFQAALDLARSAFAMQGEANRRIGATQAINRFLEAEHHYLGLLDMELEAGSLAVAPFLNTLILTSVSVARCYLELDEIQSARDHLQQGNEVLASRVRKFYDSVIGVNPAIYLHPELTDSISLTRLTQVLRYDDPTLTEAVAFESLRALFWQTAGEDPDPWLERLPDAVWRHEDDGRVKAGPIKRPRSKADKLKRLLPRLPEAFAQVEQAVESVGCVEGFQIELDYLMENNISLDDWQNVELPATSPDDPIVLVIPQESELLLKGYA